MNKKSLKYGRELSLYKGKALGVFFDSQKVYLFYRTSAPKENNFRVDRSLDGQDFNLFDDSAKILIKRGNREKIKDCQDFRISEIDGKYFLTYKLKKKGGNSLCGATSSDLINWEKIGTITTPDEAGMLVPNFKHKGKHLLYFGEELISVAVSSDFKTWELIGTTSPHILGKEKNSKVKIANLMLSVDGILLIYYQFKKGKGKSTKYLLKAALFNRDQPEKIIWDKVIWEQKGKWDKRNITPVGVILRGNELVSYWQLKDGKIEALSFPYFESLLVATEPVFISPIINKFCKNPILAPIIRHFWESKAVFNPTAFYDEGKVHIVYRAVGDDDVSTLGYARSSDGVTIDKRHKYPIYVPTQPFEGSEFMARSHRTRVKKYKMHKGSPYVSGPGVGGCEDPRITKLEGRIYMTYAAFNGYEQARSAFSSISADDFHNSKWNWTKPTLMTAKPTVWGTGGKNSCFLSEKIGGKYAIMHRFWPNILVDYVDDLEFGEDKKFLRTGRSLTFPDDMWDKGRFSPGGAVPLETDSGWVTIFGTQSKTDRNRYNLGLRLLDKRNTKKVLAEYENVCDPDGTEFLESEGIIAPRAHAWDSAKIGIGAPPIKTDDGWLLIYQAVGYHDSSKYKAGAMLLDSENPAKVLYRSSKPILEPNESYENNGHKAGVVYPCGAVIKNDDLLVYYGGADTVSCVAHANIHEFLYQLKGSGTTTFESEILH